LFYTYLTLKINYPEMSLSRVLLFLVGAALSAGCGQSNERIEYHPVESRIPYWNSDTKISTIEREYKSEEEEFIVPGGEFYESASFKSDFTVGKFSELNGLILNSGLTAKSIDNNRVLFLDVSNNLLQELNIPSKNLSEIATEGKGPGELMFARDLAIQQDTAYVVSENGTMSVFDCSAAPCLYHKTNTIDKVNTFSAAKRGHNLYWLGYARSLTDGEEKTSEPAEGIFKTDLNGQAQQSFGRIYDIDGRWIMLLYFAEGGIYTQNNGNILQYYRPFPQINVFDEEGALNSIYRIDNFILPKMKYDKQKRSFSLSMEDWSFMEDVIQLSDQKFIISVIHRTDRSIIENELKWRITREYYYLDTSDDTNYLLGTLRGESKSVYITNKHLIVQEGNKIRIANFGMK